MLFTHCIDLARSGKSPIVINNGLKSHLTRCNIPGTGEATELKIKLIKTYYNQLMEQDTVYDSLSFQADKASRAEVINPRATKALQAIVENNTSWSGLIVSNTKDVNGLDIPKMFTATEMLEFADVVTTDVENYFVQQKGHCNAVEIMTDIQEVINYDFSEA